MHFTIPTTTVLMALAGIVSGAPTDSSSALERRFSGTANFVARWSEAGLARYRYRFTGNDDQQTNCGIPFLEAIRARGGIANNWQCYYSSDVGSWVFDDNEVQGAGGADVISRAVADITGETCQASGFCP